MRSYMSVYSDPDPAVRKTAEQLGYAALLMSSSENHRRLPVAHFHTVLQPAVRVGNIKFYFNEDGVPTGYVVWAMLSNEVHHRLRTRKFSLHASEWNEGDNLWILDFAALSGYLKYISRSFANTLKLGREVNYFRIKKGTVVFESFSTRRWSPLISP